MKDLRFTQVRTEISKTLQEIFDENLIKYGDFIVQTSYQYINRGETVLYVDVRYGELAYDVISYRRIEKRDVYENKLYELCNRLKNERKRLLVIDNMLNI